MNQTPPIKPGLGQQVWGQVQQSIRDYADEAQSALRAQPAADAVVQQRLERLKRLARLLDSRFQLPFLPIPFGLDSLLGLFPAVGDAVTLLPALYIVIEARRLGVSQFTMGRLLVNILLDAFVGAIPILGDLFDVGFRANVINVEIIEKHLKNRPAMK